MGLADQRAHASKCCFVCSVVKWRKNRNNQGLSIGFDWYTYTYTYTYTYLDPDYSEYHKCRISYIFNIIDSELKYMKWITFWAADKEMKVNMILALERTT